MAKMTKAQCRKRIMEASRKLDAVMMSRHTALLPSAQRSKIYKLSGEVARLSKLFE
jgi:hypothetical protein